MKNARRCQPCEGGGRVGVFHHPLDRDVKTLSRFFPQKKKSFEVLVRLRWAMKNALEPPDPVWLTGFPRFSSPC
jgi:hypothetical protein